MNKKHIIFHIPIEILATRHSASQIRPLQMINAFRENGYVVDIVAGQISERKKKIAIIKHKIKSGVKYDFLYAESSTMPTLLTESHHLPLHPFVDFDFFSFCKSKNIKIGLFYRDIYWCFEEYGNDLKKKIAKLFYKYDLNKYNKLLDILFIPSLEMLEYIPFKIKVPTYSLPPGVPILEEDNYTMINSKTIEILYVGGIGGHYNLKKIISVISNLENIHLTICCRKEDWIIEKKDYEHLLNDNISIVHKFGNELHKYYKNADLFCLFVEPQVYWNFCVPYKLFESIGYNCPILASEGTWVAKFCKKNKLGITCKYDVENLKELLSTVNRKEILTMKNKINDFALLNTWQKRCEEISKLLKR